MTHLKPFQLSNGSVVEIEIEEQERYGAGAVGAGGKLKQTAETLKEALAGVPEIAEDIYSTVSERLSSADEIQVEFGLKLGVDMGIIVAKSSAEANFKISVKWTPESK